MYDEIVSPSKANTQQHRCLIFPIDNFLSSALIVKFSTLLDNPALSQLADEGTPTSDSARLGGTNMNDDDNENYNDISNKYNLKKQIVIFMLTMWILKNVEEVCIRYDGEEGDIEDVEGVGEDFDGDEDTTKNLKYLKSSCLLPKFKCKNWN